jgi:hypothetical protein
LHRCQSSRNRLPEKKLQVKPCQLHRLHCSLASCKLAYGTHTSSSCADVSCFHNTFTIRRFIDAATAFLRSASQLRERSFPINTERRKAPGTLFTPCSPMSATTSIGCACARKYSSIAHSRVLAGAAQSDTRRGGPDSTRL